MNAMVDIETLATTPNAAIVSIGVAWFDEGGLDARNFYIELNWGMQNRYICPKTLEWWRDEMHGEIPSGKIGIREGLGRLGAELQPAETIWAKPASFELPILEDAYRQFGMQVPWNPRKWRCAYTLSKLGVPWSAEPGPVPFDIVSLRKHNALYDATVQAGVAGAHLMDLKK